jgi:hypothetical protein
MPEHRVYTSGTMDLKAVVKRLLPADQPGPAKFSFGTCCYRYAPAVECANCGEPVCVRCSHRVNLFGRARVHDRPCQRRAATR